MQLAAVTAIALALGGCKAAEETPGAKVEKKPTGSPDAAAAVKIVDAGAARVAATDDLPAELEELAEMPELTAEATDAEIERRIDRFVEAVSAFFEVIAEHDDCDKMGRSLSRFADVNARFIANLQAKTSDKRFNEKFSKLLMSRGDVWLEKMADNLTRCAQHPAVMGALVKMAQQQQQQR